MAVSYFTGARITEFSLNPDAPGQIAHEVPSTGTTRVFNRGYGRWRGVVRFGALKGAAVHQMEAMLASLDGAAESVELPLRGRASIAAASVQVDAPSGGATRLTTAPGDMVRGIYLRKDKRLLIVTEWDASSREISVWPAIPLMENDLLTRATTVSAQSRRDATPDLPLSPHWGGPWVWNWQEAL